MSTETDKWEARDADLAVLAFTNAMFIGGVGFMGSFSGGLDQVAVCQICGSLVPLIGEIADVGKAVRLHARWHGVPSAPTDTGPWEQSATPEATS